MRVPSCAVALLITAAAHGQYIGSKACAQCHPVQYQSFTKTPMGRSLRVANVATAPEFGKPTELVHAKTERRYRMYRERHQLLMEESYAGQDKHLAYSDSRSIRYAIGSGNHARSYLAERAGRLYQAPVTYFTRAGRWDMSPGYDTIDYVGFTRRVTANCLSCHSGRPNVLNDSGDVFETPRVFAEAAIGCERCHGLGQQHMAQPGKGIVNPAKLPPQLRDAICEQCHLFGAARVSQTGKSALDFKPGEPLNRVLSVYAWKNPPATAPSVTDHPQEMKRSACWQKAQGRLWCGSCHQVHSKSTLVSKTAFYRARCLACHKHDSCRRTPDLSNIADRHDDCIACHMPRRPVIESAHVAFTDHRILRSPKADVQPPVEDARLLPLLSTELDDPVVASRNLGFAYAEVASATQRPEFHRKVVEILRPLVGVEIADAAFWQTLGEAHLALGEIENAEDAFQNAAKLDPRLAAAHYGLGYTLQLRGRLPGAIDAYRAAVDADPFKAEAFGNLAAAYFKIDHRAKALAALTTALTLEPGSLRWRDAKRAAAR